MWFKQHNYILWHNAHPSNNVPLPEGVCVCGGGGGGKRNNILACKVQFYVVAIRVSYYQCVMPSGL